MGFNFSAWIIEEENMKLHEKWRLIDSIFAMNEDSNKTLHCIYLNYTI